MRLWDYRPIGKILSIVGQGLVFMQFVSWFADVCLCVAFFPLLVPV